MHFLLLQDPLELGSESAAEEAALGTVVVLASVGLSRGLSAESH